MKTTIRSWLAGALFNELPLKVVSLLIALTLFALVRSDKDASSAVYVKVIYSLPKDRVLVSEPVPEVRVTIRGPWTRLSRLGERELPPIEVDLAFHRGGNFHFDESLVKAPPGVRVTAITPSDARLEFQPKISREVSVQPILEGEPAEGYRVAKVTAVPSTIRIEGAQNALEGLRRVRTRPLRLAGTNAPVRGEVTLENLPRYTSVEGNATIVVEADIKPMIVERVFDKVPIAVAGLTKHEGVVQPAEAKVILRGPSDVLEGISADRLNLAIDAQLEDTRGPGTTQKRLVPSGLPAGVAAEVRPEAVKLTLRRR